MALMSRCLAFFVCGFAAAATRGSPVASQTGTALRAPVSCENLASHAGPGTRITVAERVAAGAFTPPGQLREFLPSTFQEMPAFCRIAATLSPVAGSEIKIEVWMPAEGWNGKLVGVGNGGLSGAIWHFAMVDPLQRGYAVAATNGGHDGGGADASFAIGNPARLADYSWRAVHEMTVKAKAFAAAHYGRHARHAYWVGCSTGGRQGLMEAQRFPADYDGIVAGAPAYNWVPLMAWAVVVQRIATDPEVALSRPQLTLLQNAAIAACDARDGVTDRVAENPASCAFDPAQLECRDGHTSNCLTARQVRAVRALYAGVVNPRNGVTMMPGTAPGGELQWLEFRDNAFPIGANYFRDIVIGDPAWTIERFDVDRDTARAMVQDKAGMTLTRRDLRQYFRRGGTLLLWHGWTDGLIAAQSSIDYYQSVLAASGAAATSGARLFMLPGVDHCGEGGGPSEFDRLALIDMWVERGQAPDRIVAKRPAQGDTPARTRPLCAFPGIARYRGEGSTDDERNFVCASPDSRAVR
jgi:feruloyl esterase